MQGLGAFTGAYISPRTASFSCVDSRGISPGQVPLLETPGGDIAELQVGPESELRTLDIGLLPLEADLAAFLTCREPL